MEPEVPVNVCTAGLPSNLPPLGSITRDPLLGAHWAYSVTMPLSTEVRFSTACPSLYFVPVPSGFVFQPVNR